MPEKNEHGAGDRVLANLGTLLKSQFRLTDVVTRFGGEEFVVLMPYADLARATSKAGQLRSLLAGQIMEPLDNAVTASFGVADLSGEGGRAQPGSRGRIPAHELSHRPRHSRQRQRAKLYG